MGGGTAWRGTGGPSRKAPAPRRFWFDEWRDKFIDSASTEKNQDALVCLREHLTARLEDRWSEMEQEMSDWTALRLLDDDEIQNADKETEIGYALLSHWIWSGYAEAARDDDLLAWLIDGTASGPTLGSAVAETLVQKKSLVREAPQRYLTGLDELKQVMLRSLEELEFIKGMTHGLEIEACPQGNTIEPMGHTEPCQATCGVDRQETMIALCPHRAGRRFG